MSSCTNLLPATPDVLDQAAALLRAGALVAFPTETVYGLGANALDEAAVARIFVAKGRPSTNPLIVHVADVEQAKVCAGDWPPVAQMLAERFWPGPLTLVVRKADWVPANVTAGGETVGLRVPAHLVALELLRRAQVPVAAPSANRSLEVSPTTAQHVCESLGERVDLIVDGGATTIGVESTVLDVSVSPPRVLRPGMITAEMLREFIGEVVENSASSGDAIARSPGQMTRHYAPRAHVLLLASEELESLREPSDAILRIGETMPRDADAYAARLYAALRDCDNQGAARILIELPPLGDKWTAIHDRLRRAAAMEEQS